VAEPFLSEIRIFSFGFAPQGWALCDGQLLPINQNQALFALLGTTYGGNGQVNFALPNLQGNVPMHMGNGHTLGERGGEQTHTLNLNEIPTHFHQTTGSSSSANLTSPSNALWAASVDNPYSSGAPTTAMSPTCVSAVGGSQAHLNMAPFLTLNFCIALEGIFPSQN